MKIRITKRPSDESPQRVQEEWIGLVLPCKGVAGGHIGLFSRKLYPGGLFYTVDAKKAIEALSEVNPEAAMYWKLLPPPFLDDGIYFNAEACEVIIEE